MPALLVLLAALALTPVGRARADVRSRATERALAAAERDVAHGDTRAAARRLLQAHAQTRALALLVRYAELALPWDGALAPEVLRLRAASASRYLERLVRSVAESDPEIVRRAGLHAAWAAALLERDDESDRFVAEAGQLQDAATVTCLRHVAALAIAREQLERAERALALARQYVPQDTTLAAELARVQLGRGASERALWVLRERFAMAPRDLDARRDLAYALATAGSADEARALLAREPAVCEADRGCTLEHARYALEGGRVDETLRLVELRLAADARDLDALYLAADTHTRAGDFEAARTRYARILEVRPDSVRARQALEDLARAPAATR